MNKQERSSFYFGILFCFLGALCFSTKAIFVKIAYRDTDVDAVTLLALRMVFSLPFFILSALLSSSQLSNVKFTNRQWIYVALIGCLGYYISSLLDFLGLQFISAGIERLILFVYPTLVLLMNFMLFRYKIGPIQWIAVSITYVGLLLAFLGEVDLSSSQHQHVLWGSFLILLCAFTYAGYIVGSGRLIPMVGAVKFNSYAMSFACIAVLLHFFLSSDQSLFNLPASVYGISFLMAIVSTVIPSYLITLGIKKIGSDNAAIISSVGPVSTIILANIFLDESVSVTQLIGTTLILVGVLLISRSKK